MSLAKDPSSSPPEIDTLAHPVDAPHRSVTRAEYDRWKTELLNWGRWGSDDQTGAQQMQPLLDANGRVREDAYIPSSPLPASERAYAKSIDEVNKLDRNALAPAAAPKPSTVAR